MRCISSSTKLSKRYLVYSEAMAARLDLYCFLYCRSTSTMKTCDGGVASSGRANHKLTRSFGDPRAQKPLSLFPAASKISTHVRDALVLSPQGARSGADVNMSSVYNARFVTVSLYLVQFRPPALKLSRPTNARTGSRPMLRSSPLT